MWLVGEVAARRHRAAAGRIPDQAVLLYPGAVCHRTVRRTNAVRQRQCFGAHVSDERLAEIAVRAASRGEIGLRRQAVRRRAIGNAAGPSAPAALASAAACDATPVVMLAASAAWMASAGSTSAAGTAAPSPRTTECKPVTATRHTRTKKRMKHLVRKIASGPTGSRRRLNQ